MPDEPQSNEAVKLFYSYSHEDERLRDKLAKHLSILKRNGVISEWHDRDISAGAQWAVEIDDHLKSAEIILLLVSASFIASDYCYEIELKHAMEKHEGGSARVIPVILRPCGWKKAPFGKLNALPESGKAVTKWGNRDEAFEDIEQGISLVAEELKAKRRGVGAPAATTAPAAAAESVQPPVAPSPARSLVPRPPPIGFVARRDEQGNDIFALLKDALAPDKGQLVAILGPGGTGKTTLAAEVARSLRADYGQRPAWVSALGRSDFGLQTLLDDIATQLGRPDLRRLAPDLKAEQVRALLAASPSLVVLDNFEAIEPGEQARCAAFLAESTECPALITTRSRVDRADVRNVRLAAMAMDEAREFWRRLVEQSGRPEAFDGLDADEIIRHCEANPLVIQWVVGQIELAQRPRDALAYLSEGKGDAAERVFDRSFNLPQLGDDGRAALLALSLFTPDASREALAEVSGFGGDLNRVNEAVGKMSALWLVETTEGNERLFLRALKREMAKSRLSKDAHAEDLRRRYVQHFLRYSEAHAQPTQETPAALEAEKDNLRNAMDVAFASRDSESVVRLWSVLRHFLPLRGYWDEAVRSGGQAEEAARRMGNDRNATVFMMDVASIRIWREEHKEAEAMYLKALEVFRGHGDEANVSASLHQLGLIAQGQGESGRARQYYDESLEISRRRGDESGAASTTSQIGILLAAQGEFEQSKARHEESLAVRRRLGEFQGMAVDLNQLAKLAWIRNDYAGARRLFGESLKMSTEIGDRISIAIASYNLGVLAEKEGDKNEAARLFREALVIYEAVGSPEADDVRKELARFGAEVD